MSIIVDGNKKQQIAPVLHLSKEEKQFYEAHGDRLVDWRKQLMKPQIQHVPYVKRKLPISGQKTQKYQEIRKDLKHLRSVFKTKQDPGQKKRKKHDKIQTIVKEIPSFLRQNREKEGIRSSRRSKSQMISPLFEKRIQQFDSMIGLRKVFIKREKINLEQSQLFDKSKIQECPRQFMSVHFDGNSPQKKLKESIVMKKLDPMNNRSSVTSLRERGSPKRNANSSLLSMRDRRRRIKNPQGLQPIPTVIDTTSPNPIKSSRRNQSCHRVSTQYDAMNISSNNGDNYEKFKQDNKDILNRLSSLLHKKERIAFLQSIQASRLDN